MVDLFGWVGGWVVNRGVGESEAVALMDSYG